MTSAPLVSVIIPAYYSYETLEACLKALEAQTFRDFETIVINSSPEEQTRQIISNFPEVIFEQSPTRLLPHAARNRGVSLARGKLLVFSDPDCTADLDWLEYLVAAYRAGNEVVGGSMELNSDRWMEKGIHLCKYSWRLSGLHPGHRWITPTANACYSRTVWEQIGPFDGEQFCGDAILSWRAIQAGYQPWFEPRAIVRHRHPETFKAFWQQRLRRSEEFAKARIAFEEWSRLRAFLYIIGMPLSVLVVLLRAGQDAFQSQWGRNYLLTLPLQLAGHLAWSLGEAKVHLGFVTSSFNPTKFTYES